MKKYIITVLIPVFLFIGFSSATTCTLDSDCGQGGKCNIQVPFTQGTCDLGECNGCTELNIPQICNAQTQEQKTCNNKEYCCPKSQSPSNNPAGANCDTGRQYTSDGVQKCCSIDLQGGICPVNNAGNMGINMDDKCLTNGQCSLDVYSMLGIRQSLPAETRSSPGIFLQDIILSATFFVGTLITGVLIISGLLYVFAGVNGSLQAKAKKGIIGSLIGLLFVTGSYAFVRLIQFLVTGGGG